MVDRTVLATSLGGIALASVPLMGSTSVAVAACEGVQASDCTLHYGPVAESSYKDTERPDNVPIFLDESGAG